MIKNTFSLSIVLTAAAFSSAAYAAQPAGRGRAELRKYCTGDAMTYCGDLGSNDPAMQACFKANRSKLSKNCRRAIDAYGGSRR